MYSAFCAIGAVFVIFCVPETKGRELDGMAKVFRKSFRILAGKSRSSTARRREAANGSNNPNDTVIIESTKC